MLYHRLSLVEPYYGIPGRRLMPAAQRAGVHIANLPFQVRGLMAMAVEDHQRGMPAPQCVEIAGYMLAYGQGDLLPAVAQRVMDERRPHSFELMLGKAGPGRGRAQVPG